ncbi:MAG TPA: YiiG family protein [Sandaracinaceae bacterium LLY-WYZ-13_1]|nr:YiiG family protein [Sandaracinaceae bacterium LLY-WYZ-13_1]
MTQKTLRTARVASAALLLLLFTGACALPFGHDDDPPPVAPVASEPAAPAPPDEPAPSQPPEPPEPTLSPAEQQSAKITDFVEDCTNRFSQRALESRDRYLRWVDAETGPTGHERAVYGVYTISDPSDCREAADALPSREPSMPELERQADRYATAVERLAPLLRQADTYYERESYRDDDAARGRELHPQLMAAWESFETAHSALETRIRDIERSARAARLARLADDPSQRSTYLIERTMAEARAIVDEVEAMEVENRRLVAEDPEAFVTRVQTFQTHVDELRAHRPTPPDRAPGFGWGGFRRQANEVLTSALGLMRRVRDETPFDRSELRRLGTAAGWMTDGSPDELFQEFNRLVREYNSLS